MTTPSDRTDKFAGRIFLGFLLAALTVGVFLHFRSWAGAVYIDEDEARAFNLMSTGPLLYLLCRPFFQFQGKLHQLGIGLLQLFLGFVKLPRALLHSALEVQGEGENFLVRRRQLVLKQPDDGLRILGDGEGGFSDHPPRP